MGMYVTKAILGALAGVFFAITVVYGQDAFEITFRLAFHPSSTVSIARHDGQGTVDVQYGDLKTKVVRTERFALDKTVTDRFFQRVEKLSRKWLWTWNVFACLRVTFYDGISFGPVYYLAMDGFSVEGTYTRQDGSRFLFKSSNPSREIPHMPRDYDIALATYKVIDGLDKPNPSISLIEYIEQLSQYIDSGPIPVKVIGGEPFRVRFYGSLTSDHDMALKELIERLPADKQIVIDMTNFNSMGTLLYPRFRDLNSRNQDIKWIASGKAKQQLLAIGVNEKDIESEFGTGRTN
jgi:hypothetical protein